MSFSLLSKKIQEHLKELGYFEETKPQKEAIPKILEGKNVLLISPTGTGKTEAALLPILDKMHREKTSDKSEGIKTLYITPLRSLNRNLMDRITLWCSKLDLRVAVRHSDTSISERRKQTLMPPDLLITTPETLQILLVSEKMRNHLKSLRYVIIDELHEIAESKRGSQLSLGLERLRLISPEFQVIGLSATIGEPEKLAKFLVGMDRECEIIKAEEERKMKFYISLAFPNEEDEILANEILTYPEVAARLRKITEEIKDKKATLIFTNTRSEAEILASRLRMMNTNVLVHHSSLSREARLDAETSLKTGEIRGIVCTSSLELGIDIGNIDFVIQYNSPRQVTRLVQRVGRSGHYFKGVAEGIIIAISIDTFLESYAIVEKAIRGEYERIKIPEKPMDVLAHQIIGMLIEYGELEIEEILKIFRRAYPYRNLTREEIESLINALEILKPRVLLRRMDKLSKTKGSYLYYFENLSMIPDQIQFAVIDVENENFIGSLDEEFIAQYGEEGTRFVLKGEVWEIVSIDEEQKKVLCKKAKTALGVVPTWVGEEIPVEKEIAQRSSELRRNLYEGLDLPSLENIDEKEYERMKKIFEEDRKKNLYYPRNYEILIEEDEGIIVINASFGTNINRLFAKLLAFLISEKLRRNFRIYSDAYRIFVFSEEIGSKEILELIKEAPYHDLDSLIRKIFNENDNLFRFRFLHVAKRFGIIRKNVSVDKKIIIELARQYKETPIYDEALKELLSKDLDVEGIKEIFNEILSGKIKLRVSKEMNSSSREALKYVVSELAVPGNKDPRRVLIETLKTRLYSKLITLICMDCLEYSETCSLVTKKDLICPFCGSRRIAISKLPSSTVNKLLIEITKGSPSMKTRIIERRWKIIAEKIENKGRLAALVFISNVSFNKALEILRRYNEEDEEFYQDILKGEVERLKQIFRRISSKT